MLTPCQQITEKFGELFICSTLNEYTSTASQKLPRSLGTSRRPFVGPVKRAMRSAIVVGNKG